MRKVAGAVYVKVDGEQLLFRGSVTWSNLTESRESVVGPDGTVHGLKVTGEAPYLEVETTDNGALDRLWPSTDLTVTAEAVDGKAAVLYGAAIVGRPDRNMGEGSVTLRFEGERMELI